MAGKFVVEVSDANFNNEVLQSSGVVLVDFWAPWCGPCRIVSPIVDELAAQYAEKIKVCKVNVDENIMTAGSYGIQAIPTLLIFKNGQIVDRIVGALPKIKIEEAINRLL